MNNLQNIIQDVLNKAIEDGSETGLQAAVYYKGELVVDAVAGIADPASGRPVTSDTIFPVFSTTKGTLATIVHRLAERGVLDYDAPIAQYWPEFAAHGKSNIKLRHAMGHSAGMPYVPVSVGPDDIYDWDTVCAALAASEPVYAPGTKVEYHSLTYGWLVGETASRASGRTLPQLWQEELVGLLGLEDEMFCGVTPEAEPRVATLYEAGEPTPPENLATQGAPYWLLPLGMWMNKSIARRTCQPASNGIMSARAIAKHYAACLPGGTGGVELLPPSRLKLATTPDINGETGEPSIFALGYALLDPPRQDGINAFGHGGHGSSTGQADPNAGWALGFTKNNFNGAETKANLITALKDWLPES